MNNNEVQENLEKFEKEGLPKLIIESLEKACLAIEGKAKQKAPVDDGQLRQSITYMIEETANGVEAVVGSNVEYAPYVHEGTGVYAASGNGRSEVPWTYQAADGSFYSTVGQKPNPFLQEAIDEERDSILRAFEGVLE